MLARISLTLVIATTTAALGSRTAHHSSIAIVGVTVISPDRPAPLADQTVVLRDQRIASLGPAEIVPLPRTAVRIDGHGKYLVPAFWDMHVHLLTEAEPNVDLRERAVRLYLPLLVAHGVAGVRDMGAPLEEALRLRNDVAKGTVFGPEMIVTGPALMGFSQWLPEQPHSRVVKNEEEARAAVRQLAAAGVDVIKVHDFVGRNVFLALADEARTLGIPLAGHLRPGVAPDEAASRGQTTIEHFGPELLAGGATDATNRVNRFYDDWLKGGPTELFKGMSALWKDRDAVGWPSMLKRVRDSGTSLVPTLVSRQQGDHTSDDLRLPKARKYCSDARTEDAAIDVNVRNEFARDIGAAVREVHAQGIRILGGADAPGGCLIPGVSLHRELELLVAAGLPPLEALRTVTLNPAQYLERSDAGRIALGSKGDVLLLDANPLTDIRNTRRIAGVALRGRWIPKAELERMVADAKRFVAAAAQ